MIINEEQFKQHAEIDSNDDDELISLYCNSVDEFVKKYLNRNIESQAYTEYFDGDDIDDEIILKEYPVTALTSYQYRTGSYSDPTWNDFDEDYYQRDDARGIILVDTMYDGRRNIKVVYTAGYATADIPSPIKLACIKLVSKIYNKKRSDGYKDESVADASITWDKFLSDDIVALLAPYKKLTV